MAVGWVLKAGNRSPRDGTASIGIGLGAVKVTANDWLGEGNAVVTITKVGGARVVGGGS